jgi:hypothetical protein
VKDGHPAAVVVMHKPEEPPRDRRGRRTASPDERAAETIVRWIEKMSGVELSVLPEARAGKPAIYVGEAAVRQGLDLTAVAAPMGEAVRIVSDDSKVLLAGTDGATLKAACRFLETLGCRYLFDHELGEVAPQRKTITVGKLDIKEAPKTAYRRIWGSCWSGPNLWKIWNGSGGQPFSTGHSWGKYIDRKAFEEHPEWFRLRGGERKPSDWYCTSNPGVREAFTQGVLKAIAGGARHPSISPPDGRQYCECATCTAQDDPKSTEPSTGTVNVSNRYLDFYRHIAERARKEYPDSILNFYCYADYTQAPTSGIRLPSNCCAWIAPIRYCRFHRIGSDICPSRRQLRRLLGGWSEAVDKIAYRTYNYNLAECLVPFSKVSIWAHDIPYLRDKGCIGFNLESIRNWEIYGPHLYLSIRLAYDPDIDVGALMDDYYRSLFGPRVAPLVQQYWERIDEAFAGLDCHTGSFHAIHLVYSPAFLAELQELLNRAAALAKGDAAVAARVAMFRAGLDNAADYERYRVGLNTAAIVKAQDAYDALIARNETEDKKKLGQAYTVRYAKRFLGQQMAAAAKAATKPNRILAVLPDKMKLEYDPEDQGVARGYQKTGFDDAEWRTVRTYSAPLNAQGLEDRQTILWYRCSFDAPKNAVGKLKLVLLEIDGNATAYVNGKEIAVSEKKRTPFDGEITDVVKPGRNTLAVRCDHSSITELDLGGILRPIYLVQTTE